MNEIGPIDIKLTASGITEVLSAFKNVEDRVMAMERRMTQMSQQGSQNRARAAKDEAANKGKNVNDEVSAFEKGEKTKTAAANKSAADRKRLSSDAIRGAEQQANAEVREAERSANARSRISRQLAGRIVSDFRSTLGIVTRIAGQVFALGGGFSVASAFSKEMSISRIAQNTALTTQVPGKPQESISASALEGQARGLGKTFNVDAADVLESQKELMSKSSLGASVLGLTPELLKLAKAENTGEDAQGFQNQLFRSAGIMIKQGMSKDHVMTMLRGMVGQGRAAGGTVEFSEMAKVLPRITSKAGLYEGNQEGNALKLTSMFQSAFQATGDVSEAATGVERLSDDLIKDSNKGSKSKMAALLGHSINRNGKIEDPFTIIPEAFQKSGGDIFKLENAGLNVRSNRVLLGYLDTFQKAEALQKGSGGQAVSKAMIGEVSSQLTKADVDKDYEARRATTAEKVDEAFRKLNTTIAENLIPHLIPLIEKLGALSPEIGKLLGHLGDFIDWAAKNPWEAAFAGIGLVLAKAVAVEVAASGLKSILAGALGTGGAVGAGGLALGTVSAITIGAVAGLSIGHMITGALDQSSKQDKSAENADNIRTNQLWMDIKTGKPGSIEAAQTEIDRLRYKNSPKGFVQNQSDKVDADILKGNYGTAMVDYVKTFKILPGPNDPNAVKDAKILQDAIDESNRKKAEMDQKSADTMMNAATVMSAAALTMSGIPMGVPSNFVGGTTNGHGASSSWGPMDPNAGPRSANGANLPHK